MVVIGEDHVGETVFVNVNKANAGVAALDVDEGLDDVRSHPIQPVVIVTEERSDLHR